MVRDYRIFEGTQGSGGKGSIGAGLDLDDDDDGIYRLTICENLRH